MSIYFNMKELSRSIVFKRIKSFPKHRKKRLLLIEQKLLYNNYQIISVDSHKTDLSGIISKH